MLTLFLLNTYSLAWELIDACDTRTRSPPRLSVSKSSSGSSPRSGTNHEWLVPLESHLAAVSSKKDAPSQHELEHRRWKHDSGRISVQVLVRPERTRVLKSNGAIDVLLWGVILLHTKLKFRVLQNRPWLIGALPHSTSELGNVRV
jgi:hypothetical protein